MSITDELRHNIEGTEQLYGCECKHLLAIADRIDAAVDGMIELPKDADGEYIHVGDVLDGYGKTITVVEMRYGRSGWVLISEYGNAYADCFAFTHHHEPTVEDVLREFASDIADVLGGDDFRLDDSDELFADYAAKLQLREDA